MTNSGSLIKRLLQKALGCPSLEAELGTSPIFSGAPAQIIQATFDQAARLFSPKLIQLLVEESSSGRMFLWHSEPGSRVLSTVSSEEFDLSAADTHLHMMPPGDWIVELKKVWGPLSLFNAAGKKLGRHQQIPPVLQESFARYTNVLSVVIDLGDEWQGRFLLCDAAKKRSNRSSLEELKRFSLATAQSIHAAHLCLRACRDTAAEERARLARELHDGAIQSLLGVELRLESLKARTDVNPGIQKDVTEVQGILRREAADLRNMVNDSRRRALRPERLLEFLSDLLERFQRNTGIVTRFFTDLDSDRMPPRICHEIARMAEEAINNAHKHSKASTLTVRVGTVGSNWVLVIVDDGRGFNFNGTRSLEDLVKEGIGPRVIKERVLSLGGNLMIESTSAGARIEVSIPKSRLANPFRLTSLTEQRYDESYSNTTG